MPLKGITRSPEEVTTILLFSIEVFNLGLAFRTSSVADNLSLGNVPFVGIIPKYVDGRFKLILPEVNPLAVSVEDEITTLSLSI